MTSANRTRDYYEVLGVSRTADAEELQRAYRKLARRHHPDVNRSPDAEERFKEINDAYHVLSDPATRARYDRFGPDFRQIPEGYEDAPRRGAPGGFADAGFPGGPGGQWSFDGGDVDIEDLLSGMFAGRGGPGGPRSGFRPGGGAVPGADQEAELELAVEEAYRGGQRHITLRGPGGPRGYDVTIPPGVVDGQRIRLAGQGGRPRGGAPPGDLYLVVRLSPHPLFRLDGRDVHVDLPVTPWEAALGGQAPVRTPGGEAVVAVPPGSSTGRRLRLRGQGMPHPKGAPGDLYAEVKVMVPARVEGRERELYEELAKTSTFDPRGARR